MSRLLSWIFGERAWVLLLVVGSIGAWLYADLRHARAERDALAHWAEVACAQSGSAFQPAGAARAGTACRQRIAALADFKAHTDELTARTLAKALADHDARALKDNLAAMSAAQAARDAATRMEAADAEAERRNLVDREWFAAVNGVAGLRAPRR